MTGATQLADFARSFRLSDLSEETRQAARLHLLDALGVGIAASAGPEQAGWAGTIGPTGVASTLNGASASPVEAALLNGSLIHSLEFDDTHVGSVIHGSAVAAPAALAAAEANGGDGETLLSAFVIAWEIMIRIGLAAPGTFQARGAQVTSVAGAIGAAVAVAHAWGLDQNRTTAAIGIAGSQASGLLAFLSDGSSVKALNPGWAAHTGVMAAQLARGGMTGPAEILEHKFGPMQVFGADPSGLRDALADLGTRWYLPEAAFKLYPACHYIHPFLELTEGLMADGLTATDLASMTLHVAAEQIPLIADPWPRRQDPGSGYDGKWGLPYCIALMLTDGRVDVASFETAPRDEVVTLARKMSLARWEGSGFPARFPARIDVTTTSGAKRTVEVETVRGAPGREIGTEDVLTKVRANLSRRFDPVQSERIISAVIGDPLPDLAALSKVLQAG